VTVRLLEGARRGLAECKVDDADVTEVWVPGAFELPLIAKTFAESGEVDAVICLGCVIRGETAHYEHVRRADGRGHPARGPRHGTADRVRRPHDREPRSSARPLVDPGGENAGEEGHPLRSPSQFPSDGHTLCL